MAALTLISGGHGYCGRQFSLIIIIMKNFVELIDVGL